MEALILIKKQAVIRPRETYMLFKSEKDFRSFGIDNHGDFRVPLRFYLRKKSGSIPILFYL